MSKQVWINLGRLVLLMALQLLVINNINMGGYVMPMIYLLFIIMLPTNLKKVPVLLIAFATGLFIDIMSNALGFHALACTVMAMAKIMAGNKILTRGEPVAISTPGLFSVAPVQFITYSLFLLGTFYLVFFIAEMWGFRGFGSMLLATIASTLATTALIVVYQLIFLTKNHPQKVQ